MHNSGVKGLRRYLSRLFLWRCSLAWYAFLVFGIPSLFLSGFALKGNISEASFPSGFDVFIYSMIE